MRLTGSFHSRRQDTAESIYHLDEQGQIEPMTEEPFDLEDTLQKLVADHPELLSGEQMDPADPRRWILINREHGIPDTAGGGSRWAVDHLLIDQDAVPTLVEVKRSSNSEIRRTIVGQMLDYAAHARHTWDVRDIRQAFEESRTGSGQNPDHGLAALLQFDGGPDADEFWQRVETNLRAARLRLLFVADVIPDELTRVVEFLNEQMPGIEVLAVEIRQFRGVTGRTLVPRVIGRTAAAPARASTARSRMDLDEFLNQMPSPEAKEATGRLLDVVSKHNVSFEWGSRGVSIRARCPSWRLPLTVAWLYPTAPRSGWRECTFGCGNWSPDFFESLPSNLRGLLESWADQFSTDSFTIDASSTGAKAWTMSREDAAANIDVLAERLENVLVESATLPVQP